jgi:hypothetical protein
MKRTRHRLVPGRREIVKRTIEVVDDADVERARSGVKRARTGIIIMVMPFFLSIFNFAIIIIIIIIIDIKTIHIIDSVFFYYCTFFLSNKPKMCLRSTLIHTLSNQ